MKCDYCGSTESVGLYRSASNDGIYKLVYSCFKCLPKEHVEIGKETQAVQVHELAVSHIEEKLTALINQEFRCIINELKQVKRHRIPILKPERITAICCDCKTSFSGFKTEFDRLEWKTYNDGITSCNRCRHNRSMVCTNCGNIVYYNTLETSTCFVEKQYGYKMINDFYICKKCYPTYSVHKDRSLNNKSGFAPNGWDSYSMLCNSIEVIVEQDENLDWANLEHDPELARLKKINWYKRTGYSYRKILKEIR